MSISETIYLDSGKGDGPSSEEHLLVGTPTAVLAAAVDFCAVIMFGVLRGQAI